jgi:predicted RNA-binding protein with PIN domain
VTTTLVDGNNVIGSVPDGWWRDRPGAVRRLVARLQRFVAEDGRALHVVFDVGQPDLPEGDHDGVFVHYATRKGRDAADDRILELLDAGFADEVEVVTSDRGLADGSRLRGASVTGAGSFLERLEQAGC